jgi:hypothetical protein
MVVTKQKSIFVTFGAGRSGWIGAAKRITMEAEKTGLFEFCFNLDEKWLQTWDPDIYEIGLNLRKNHPPRGFGYWTWKPSVLMWAHLHFPNHNIFYFDAGTQIDTAATKVQTLNSVLNKVNTQGQIAWHLPQNSDAHWTKAEVLNHLVPSQGMQNSPQVQSGFIGLSPGKERDEFVRHFRNTALEKDGFFFSDEISQIQNVDFIEHRHDQSLLSCLWKLRGFYSEKDPSYPFPENPFPVIAFRNNSRLPVETSMTLRSIQKILYLAVDFAFRRRR